MSAFASPLTSATGDNLRVYDFDYTNAQPARAAILLVHALGEHSMRHVALAQQLVKWGFMVRAYDQYGHGRSEGERGHTVSYAQPTLDLADVVDNWRIQLGPHIPILLMGFGSGGVIAAEFAHAQKRPIAGLVLSSPTFAVHLRGWQRLLLKLLPRTIPAKGVPYAFNPHKLTANKRVVESYSKDPLVHHKISYNLVQYILQTGARLVREAGQWHTPTLLLYAGKDQIVINSVTEEFVQRASPSCLQVHSFDEDEHEIFHAPDTRAVYGQLQRWLDTQCQDHYRAA